MNTTYRQGATATPKADIHFKANSKGRTITLKTTARLWVTNSQMDQKATGYVMIGRCNGHSIGQGYAFTEQQCSDLFNFT